MGTTKSAFKRCQQICADQNAFGFNNFWLVRQPLLVSVKVITGFLAEATARISDTDSDNNLKMNFSWKPRSHSGHPSCPNPTAPLLAVDGRESLPLSARVSDFPSAFLFA